MHFSLYLYLLSLSIRAPGLQKKKDFIVVVSEVEEFIGQVSSHISISFAGSDDNSWLVTSFTFFSGQLLF